MPKRTDLLDRIDIASPCSAEWDEMAGNEQVRFCQHCSLYVHDLSKIMRKDALKLVAASKGKLCVRYYTRPDGSVATAAHARPISQLKRRLSRIAAGAVTATLSIVSNAAAQQNPAPAENQPLVTIKRGVRSKERPAAEGPQTASLVGTVLDPNDAVIPGAKVTLTSEEARREWSTESDDAGEFRFLDLKAGVYKLKIEAPGFMTFERESVTLRPGVEKRINPSLNVGGTMGMVIAMPDTFLIKAIWREDTEEVAKLVASGADVNELDDSINSTPLMEAVGAGKMDLVRLLLYAGADANAKNSGGRTALMRLDEDSTAEMVRALLDAGAKVNVKDEDGGTPLHVAAALENKEILQILLDAGAKVNARNKEGKTALMVAAEEGNVDNVKALIWAGADVNRKDKEGATALKYARDSENEEVVKLLNSYGVFE